MNVIYKYPLELVSNQLIEGPSVFRPLDVQLQNETLCLWAEVDPESPPGLTAIRIVGTGSAEVEDPDEYIATVQQGPYVWHIYLVP